MKDLLKCVIEVHQFLLKLNQHLWKMHHNIIKNALNSF